MLKNDTLMGLPAARFAGRNQTPVNPVKTGTFSTKAVSDQHQIPIDFRKLLINRLLADTSFFLPMRNNRHFAEKNIVPMKKYRLGRQYKVQGGLK